MNSQLNQTQISDISADARAESYSQINFDQCDSYLIGYSNFYENDDTFSPQIDIPELKMDLAFDNAFDLTNNDKPLTNDMLWKFINMVLIYDISFKYKEF